jgi:predicted PurR-regulated permease PerM
MHKVQIYFFTALFIAVLLLTGFLFWPFLAPIALAFMAAVILKPVYNYFFKLVKGSSWLAASITVILTMVIVIGPLLFLGTQLLKESYLFYAGIQERGLGGLDTFVNKTLAPLQKLYPELELNLGGYAQALAGWVVSNLGSFFSFTASTVFGFFLGMMTLYYLLKDGTALRAFVKRISPLADKYDEQIMRTLENAVNSIVRGSLLIAIIQGIFVSTGFYLFDISNAVLWGTIASVAALIPNLGTALILVPAIVYLFITGSTGSAIGLSVWGFVVVGTIDNVLLPLLLRRGFKAHPLPLLLSVLGGVMLFGPVGLFLGPLVIALLIALIDIYTIIGKNEA